MGEQMLSPARARPLSSTQRYSVKRGTAGETLELVRAYYRIIDPMLRKRVFDLLKSMGPSELTASLARHSNCALAFAGWSRLKV